MKRNCISPKDNAKNISFHPTQGLQHSIVREASVVDEFYFEKGICPDDGVESVSVCDPIIILFNQQRLDNMGTTAAKAFIDALAPKSISLQELRKQCSDEDLMTMVKSRHLQSPAEILSWCRYMNENISTFNKEVQALVEARIAEEAEVRKAEEAKKAEQVSVEQTKVE